MMKKTDVSLVTLAIFLTTFMTAIEGTIVSTAMPTIVADLDGLDMMNWVVSIFLLMTAVSTPIYGKLADTFGRKPVFLFGIFVFVLGSGLCGLAGNMLELILFRVIQGLGSGAVQTVAIIVLADIYAPALRAKMLGINSSFWGVASVIAPLLGGFIVQKLSWHWVFEINVPLGIIAFLLVAVYLKEGVHYNHSKLDLKGTVWLSSFLLAMMLFFQKIEANPDWLLLVTLFAIVVISGFAFYRAEQKAEDPVLPLSLLANREFLILNLINLLAFGIVIGFEFYLPTWMQGINGVSASIAGFVVTPSSVFWIVGSFIVGNLIAKWGTSKVFKILLGLLLLVELGLILVPLTTPFWVFLIFGPFAGLSFGAITMQTLVRSQMMVPSDQIGIATSFNTLMKYLGQTILIALYGIVFNLVIASHLVLYPKLTAGMINKVVSAQNAQHLNPTLLPDLRRVLFSGLKSVYIIGFILVLLAIFWVYQITAKRRHHKTEAAHVSS